MKSEMEAHPKNWANGGSVIVDSKGTDITGSLVGEEGIIYADIDSDLVIKECQNLDISGHYS